MTFTPALLSLFTLAVFLFGFVVGVCVTLAWREGK